MTTLLNLAQQCCQATAERQGQLIEQAWDLLAENSREFCRFALASPESGFENNAAKFGAALEARAFESAAMMLVPEGFDWAVFRTNGGLTIHAWCGDRMDVFGETPALALTAACLRAHMEGPQS